MLWLAQAGKLRQSIRFLVKWIELFSSDACLVKWRFQLTLQTRLFRFQRRSAVIEKTVNKEFLRFSKLTGNWDKIRQVY